MCLAAAKFTSCLVSKKQKGKSCGYMEDFQEGLESDPVFLSKTSQVLRHGFMRMTQEPSNSHLNLTAHQPYTQNCKTSSLKLREHLLFFVTCTELCFMNLFHKERL